MNERAGSQPAVDRPKGGANVNHADLVVLTDPDGAEANAVRALRASLRFTPGDHPPRTVLLASVDANSRASWLAANLATAFALAGDRAILLDANLREPRLHEYFGVPNNAGVATFLHGEGSNLPLTNTPIAGLSILPAGTSPRDAAGALATPRFAALLAAVREVADFVILDAAPLATSADVLSIAPLLEGVVLVIEAGKTKRPAAIRVKEQLERIGAHLVGVALTGVPRQRGAGGY